MKLLEKTYDGESLVDIERDIYGAFDEDITPAVLNIPVDEHGIQQGTFKVTIEWLPE